MLFLMALKRANPLTIILEEVPPYLDSQIGKALIETIKQMGYNVEYKMLKGTDFGELMVRKRVAIIATTPPSVPKFPTENPIPRKMGEILLSPEDYRCEWFTRETKAWLFEHWEKEEAKGNNFQSQIITVDTAYCSAITKRYFAQQGSNPVVAHPEEEGVYRWLTLVEVKRLMGLPDDYDLGNTKTLAGEVMGQGVLVKVFQKVIQENKN
jgi:site-specific DNA-cytosine methylase